MGKRWIFATPIVSIILPHMNTAELQEDADNTHSSATRDSGFPSKFWAIIDISEIVNAELH